MSQLPTKIKALPHNLRANLDRETKLAISTITYADSVYWSSNSGHQAIRDLLQSNFLDSLVFCHNEIARMSGEDAIDVPLEAVFNPNWRQGKLHELIHDINEALYLGATHYVADARDDFRIPAVQGLFRATYILRSIIEDFSKKG